MTPQEEYKTYADNLISDFPHHKEKYVTAADIMATGILADAEHDEINRKIMMAAKEVLNITPKQFQQALGQRRKEFGQASPRRAAGRGPTVK